MPRQTKEMFLRAGTIIVFTCFFIFTSGTGTLAAEVETNGFFNLYKVDDTFAVGLKGRVWESLYATGNIEYHYTGSDLQFRAGVVYFLPKRVLFFQFYGGGGVQFSRNNGFHYPYLLLGTNYLFLFSEIIHPLEKTEAPRYRSGFSFKF